MGLGASSAATVSDSGVIVTRNLWKDYCNGVAPSAGAGWAIAPANLGNATDGSDTTSSGTGTTVQTANNNSYWRVNLTAPETLGIIARVKVGIFITGAATCTAGLSVNDGGANTYTIATTTSSTEVVTTAVLMFNSNTFANGQFTAPVSSTIQVDVITSSGAQTASANLYTLEFWGLSRSTHA